MQRAARKKAADTAEATPTHAHLRAWRQFRGLTQATAAARLGVERATLSRWERGTPAPRADDLARLAATYATTPAALLRPPTQPDFLATLERIQRIANRLDADSLDHWLAVGEAMARGR
jgi:transcriptional regulator with XRE-family HTH domain